GLVARVAERIDRFVHALVEADEVALERGHLLGRLAGRLHGLVGFLRLLVGALVGRLRLVRALDRDVHADDRRDQRERGHGEQPRRALLASLLAADRHLVLQALLLEGRLVLLPFGGLVGLDPHAGLALGARARILHRELLVTLGALPGLLGIADPL